MTDIANALTFSVKNLGPVQQGSISPKPLTLLCGPNNSGKTWVMYALHHYYAGLNLFNKNEDEISIPDNLDGFNSLFLSMLPDIFNVSGDLFQKADFSLEDENEEVWALLTSGSWREHDAFLMPAERNGLHLFFRELSTRRTALLHHASRENIDIRELLRDVIRSRYASPIATYINWLNSLADYVGYRSPHFHEFAEQLKKELAEGTYKVDKSTGSITFKPYQKKRDGKAMPTLDLHVTSSTVKSLFGLWFYLEHRAKPGDILMIDEPELNVHPENQRKIARFFARLVNAGLRVVISTHSDYIVREINTLIMLNQEGAEDLRKKHKYAGDETLSTERVAAYLFDDRSITPFQITHDDGIYATTFDEVIDKLNTINNDVYYSLQERKGE